MLLIYNFFPFPLLPFRYHLLMCDNLSILEAVTKSTAPISASETSTPPSPVAPLFGQSGDDIDLSFAYISTESIDLASIKKAKT
ncbi:hypothetical protein BC941DRAFT_413090, partial [Chlamydoabsidia padenii]